MSKNCWGKILLLIWILLRISARADRLPHDFQSGLHKCNSRAGEDSVCQKLWIPSWQSDRVVKGRAPQLMLVCSYLSAFELLCTVLILWGDSLLFQAYLDELVELHRRLMTLRERHILQQVRNDFQGNPFQKPKHLVFLGVVWKQLGAEAATTIRAGVMARVEWFREVIWRSGFELCDENWAVLEVILGCSDPAAGWYNVGRERGE